MILDFCTTRRAGLLDVTRKSLFQPVARCNFGIVAKNDRLTFTDTIGRLSRIRQPRMVWPASPKQSPDNPVGSIAVASVRRHWRS